METKQRKSNRKQKKKKNTDRRQISDINEKKTFENQQTNQHVPVQFYKGFAWSRFGTMVTGKLNQYLQAVTGFRVVLDRRFFFCSSLFPFLEICRPADDLVKSTKFIRAASKGWSSSLARGKADDLHGQKNRIRINFQIRPTNCFIGKVFNFWKRLTAGFISKSEFK